MLAGSVAASSWRLPGVAAEHDGDGARHDALDVAAQQVLRLGLVVGALRACG